MPSYKVMNLRLFVGLRVVGNDVALQSPIADRITSIDVKNGCNWTFGAKMLRKMVGGPPLWAWAAGCPKWVHGNWCPDHLLKDTSSTNGKPSYVQTLPALQKESPISGVHFQIPCYSEGAWIKNKNKGKDLLYPPHPLYL